MFPSPFLEPVDREPLEFIEWEHFRKMNLTAELRVGWSEET